jgi:hypothetical protein
MSGIQMMMKAVSGGVAIVPSVSDIVIETTVASGIGIASIYFNETTVGSIEELVKRNVSVFAVMGNDDAGSPVDHTGEWTNQNAVGSEWEVAMTNLISGSFVSEFAAVGVFTSFATANMFWQMNRAGGKGYTPGTSTVVADFTIREVADTGNSTVFQVTLRTIQV